MIITTGKPTGYLRTEKQYENFIAEFEWMHMPPKPTPSATPASSSGAIRFPPSAPATRAASRCRCSSILRRQEKAQYTSHGDIFSIWGATCKPDRPHPKGWKRCLPSENRCKGANEWNHYRVDANDGVIKLAVNGKEVSGVSECTPAQGLSRPRIGRVRVPIQEPQDQGTAEHQSEGGRNRRSCPRPSRTSTPAWTCAAGKAVAEHKQHWKPRGWILAYDGNCKADDPHLWTTKEFGNFEMIVDWRLPKKKDASSGILLRGSALGQIAIGTSPLRFRRVQALSGR